MLKTRTRNIAVGCVLVAIFAGAAGAQVFDALQRTYANTGLFSVSAEEVATVYVALDDRRGGAPTRVILQLINETGVVVASNEVTLLPGQSTRIRKAGPGLLRAHIESSELGFQMLSRRRVLPSAEVGNTIHSGIRPIPMYDPFGQGGGRN